MGRVGLLAGDDSANFFEFFDQVRLGVETAGGVNQKNVYAAAFCCLHAIENDRGRVGTRAVFDDFDAHALPPDIELFDSRSAKRVAGHEQDLFSGALVLRREFADRCRLADPVDAEKQNHPRPG